MILVTAALGALGLVSILSRRTLLGVLVGVQLLLWGASTIFVAAGGLSAAPIQGHLFGIFITLSAVALLVVGYALAVRMSYLGKPRSRGAQAEHQDEEILSMNRLRTMKN
jgi:NADH:ubiquinone oxidoreductase subunit K